MTVAATSIAVAIGVGPVGPADAAPLTVTYTTPGESVYVVPDDVSTVRIEVIGAPGQAGGGAKGGPGGMGGDVIADYDGAYPGMRLYVEVAALGGNGDAGYGATGYAQGGNGGQASAVQGCSVTSAQCFGDSRIVVAGGGGGGGSSSQPSADPDNPVIAAGGAGGDAGQPGAGGATPDSRGLTGAQGGHSGSTNNAGGFPGIVSADCGGGSMAGVGGQGTLQAGTSGTGQGSASGGAARGGGGGGGHGFAGGGGGGGGGGGYAGGGGGGGGYADGCAGYPYSGGGGGGGGGINAVVSGTTVSSGAATTRQPLVRITPLRSQTISFDSPAPSDAYVGGPAYLPQATASSGLIPVTFSVASDSAAVCALDNDSVTFIGPGLCTVDADQAGDADTAPAPQASQTFPVAAAVAPTFTSAEAADATISKPATVTISTVATPTATLTESGSLPAGMSFVDNGDGTATISGTPAPGTAGDHPITVSAQNPIGSADQRFVLSVSKQASIVTLSASHGRTGAVIFSIDVTGGDPPSGRVDLHSGSIALGSVVLDASGHASLTTTGLPAGTDVVTADYAGDDAFQPGSGSTTVTVAAPLALAVTGIDPRGPLGVGGAALAMGLLLVLGRRIRRIARRDTTTGPSRSARPC